VNRVCPGIVMTDFVRQNAPDLASVLGLSYEQLVEALVGRTATGRATTAGEVAAMSILLASGAGAGITGAALSVDGGMAC
jgi:3-hydroxybutyrate dehydrogenase